MGDWARKEHFDQSASCLEVSVQSLTMGHLPSLIRVLERILCLTLRRRSWGGAELGPSVLDEPVFLLQDGTTENRDETHCQNSYQQDITDSKTLGE